MRRRMLLRSIALAVAAKLLPLPLIALSLSALLVVGSDATARNIIVGFTKPPTFMPPAGCIPRTRTYGLLSRCEKPISPGRKLVVLVDTAAGALLGGDPARNREFFVKDHVAEIKAHWMRHYSRTVFSSRVSDVTPGNAPRQGTSCIEYSIRATDIERATNKQPVPVMVRVEGLTCAWNVESPSPGKWNLELFWLEVYDRYTPSAGQKPLKDFRAIVRGVFASVRFGAKPTQRLTRTPDPKGLGGRSNGGSAGRAAPQTQPRCRDVGGYEAYMKRTGKVCRID